MKDIEHDSGVEDALRKAHERFEAAIAAADVTVFDQDRELRYTWIHNPALGLEPGDVIGKRGQFRRAQKCSAALTRCAP